MSTVIAARIVVALQQGPKTANELEDIAHLDAASVRRRLYALRRAGFVSQGEPTPGRSRMKRQARLWEWTA